MKISKPFVIATEGPTVDGRNISREWIQQMAASYDPKAYTAVANIEHLLSLSPDGMFNACGKVISLGTQEATVLGEKKLQLTAVVEVDDVVASMQKAGKKAFSSMEVAANFIGKGFAYLTGLAFTDKPASLGTESMKFSAQKANIYSFSNEIEIEFADVQQEKLGDSLFAKVKALLVGKDKKDEDRFSDTGKAVEAIAESQRITIDAFAAVRDGFKAVSEDLKKLNADIEKDRKAFADLKAKLDATPAGAARPAAAGGDTAGLQKTDC